jgi:hypothetical protein
MASRHLYPSGATAALLALASAGGAAAQSDGFNLMLLNSTGAVCLDGTPGGFYYRPGAGNGTHKWLIELVRAPWLRPIQAPE